MSLRLARPLLDSIERHAREAYPEECCGVLLGRAPEDFDRPGRRVEPGQARRLDNAWEAPARGHRYQVEPDTLMRLEKELRGTGTEIVGWYHSHPDLPAWPSPFDLHRAWPCYSYLILSVQKGRVAAARSWMRSEDGHDFSPEPLEVG